VIADAGVGGAALRPTVSDQYEALRTAAIGDALTLEARRGLALFLRRGMWGWARAASAPTVSPRPTPVAVARSSADDEQRAIIHLFAAMAVRSTNPRAHERIT
jgi:hypothetical protein